MSQISGKNLAKSIMEYDKRLQWVGVDTNMQWTDIKICPDDGDWEFEMDVALKPDFIHDDGCTYNLIATQIGTTVYFKPFSYYVNSNAKQSQLRLGYGRTNIAIYVENKPEVLSGQICRIRSVMTNGMQEMYLNGTMLKTGSQVWTASTSSLQYSMFLGAINYDGLPRQGSWISGVKIGEIKIKHNGELIANMIPFYDPASDQGCFYDIVRKEYFFDQTGVGFVCGPKAEKLEKSL